MTNVSDPGVTAKRVIRAFEELPALASRDADLVRRGRFLTCDFEIGVGATPLAVSIAEGGVTHVRRGPFLLRPWTFAIRAEPDARLRFLEPCPAPGFHDLFAMNKAGRVCIEGNLVPLMGNLQYVKDLLALPRRGTAEGARP